MDTFDGNLHPVKFQTVVNAAGPYAAQLARLMGIGTSEDFSSPLSVGLPVEPRKRYVFQFYAEDGPMLNVPLTIDASGKRCLPALRLCYLYSTPTDGLTCV